MGPWELWAAESLAVWRSQQWEDRLGGQCGRDIRGLKATEGALLLRDRGSRCMRTGGVGLRELCRPEDHTSQKVWVGSGARSSQHLQGRGLREGHAQV